MFELKSEDIGPQPALCCHYRSASGEYETHKVHSFAFSRVRKFCNPFGFYGPHDDGPWSRILDQSIRAVAGNNQMNMHVESLATAGTTWEWTHCNDCTCQSPRRSESCPRVTLPVALALALGVLTPHLIPSLHCLLVHQQWTTEISCRRILRVALLPSLGRFPNLQLDFFGLTKIP